MKRKNLLGMRFGRWLVIKYSHTDEKRKSVWICKCDCGTEKAVRGGLLLCGDSKSCGCYIRDNCRLFRKTHGQSSKENRTPEYTAYANMKSRCYNPNNSRYADWGGRGITVCERWLESYENFFSDMGKKPSKYHSLDRYPDTNGNYEKSNCRWATTDEQQRNKTDNVWYEHNGIRMIQMDWASYFKVDYRTLVQHIEQGKTFEQVYNFYLKKGNITQ